MAQRALDYLGVNRLSIVKQLPWQADLITINNPTNQPVYIRLGGQDLPAANNYDDVVPPYMYRQIRVHTAFMVVALGGTPTQGATLLPDAAVKVMVKYSVDEPAETAATYPLQTINQATSVTSANASSGTLGPFDLGQWGGLLLFGQQTSALLNGHGYATYQVSDTPGPPWIPIQRLPLWPGVALNAQLPRVKRYAQVVWQCYPPPFDQVATFQLIARPTLAEILNISESITGLILQSVWLTNFVGNLDIYFPGDLVNSVDWQIDGGGASNSITIDGALIAPMTTNIENLYTLSAMSGNAWKGTISEPFPINRFRIGSTLGLGSGSISLIPRLYGGSPDVLGDRFDPASALTIPGILRSVNNSVLGLQSSLTAISNSVLSPHGGATLTDGAGVTAGAGVWFNSGTDLPAGGRFISGTVGTSNAGLVQVGVGPAAGPVQHALLSGFNAGYGGPGQPLAYDYSSPGWRRIFLYHGAGAFAVSYSLYTG